MLGHLFHVLCLGVFTALGAFILFNMRRDSLLCLGHLSYMLCPGVLYCARDIYFICFVWGFFTALGHLFYVPRLGSFTALGLFILSSAFRGFSLLVGKFISCATLEGSLSHLGHLFHVLCSGALHQTQSIYFTIMWVSPKYIRFLEIVWDRLIVIWACPLHRSMLV